MAVIASGSHVTLHYRLAAVREDGEREVVSKFGSRTATLQVDESHIAPELEWRLIGLAEGTQALFDLAGEQAFGQRSPELIQTLTRSAFDQYADPSVEYHAGNLFEFNAASGRRLAGVLKYRSSERVVVDFNHPLAGMAVRFSVHVIGVL